MKNKPALPPLALYVHLPWCERKCPYCDFNSHESENLPEQDYLHALLLDLRDAATLAANRPVTSVFIGGGTPSLFSAHSIDRLLAGIRSEIATSADLEVTMEANPGSAEADKFVGFRQAGVNRLSLGVQSFDDAALTALGRVHNSEQAHRAVEMTQSAGFESFNIDLMHGLPGQSRGDAAQDLAQALAYQPPHLSWYQLTIEPNTVFYKRPPTLPIEDTLADIQQVGEEQLAGAGMVQYEVSAYARGEASCRHNLNYWTFGDYLGIGAGAHGKLSFADGRIERYSNRRQPAQYMAGAGQADLRQWHPLLEEERAGEFMLNALRLNQGSNEDVFEARTGLSAQVVRPQLQQLQQRGLVDYEQGTFRATTLGRRFLDTVIAEFFPD